MSQSQMIFVNLPVKDLEKSVAFYKAIGFTQNMEYSDNTAACMVLSESIYVMILTHAKWRTFTQKPIVEAQSSAQVMLCISRPTKAAVHEMVEQAAKAGGKADPNPSQDYGFMFSRSLEDPDGHIWEPAWMES